MGGSSDRDCRNEDFVLWGKDCKPDLALKWVDGRPKLTIYDEEYVKNLFQEKLDRFPRKRGCFRDKWSRYKGESKGKGKRRLSPQLAEARELSQSPYSPEVLARESALASSYCREKSNQVVVLKRKDSDEVIGLQYPYRFSSSRVAKLKKFLNEVVKPNLMSYDKFLAGTFTIDFSWFASQYEAYCSVGDRWNSLWTAVRDVIRRVLPSGLEPAMVRGFEWQKNGMGIHVHALFCGVDFLDANWVRKLWHEPNGFSVELTTIRNWKDAFNYVMKYALKDATLDEGEELDVSQVINLAVGARAYGISRALRLGFIKHNSNSEWVFLGQIDLETYNNLSVDELLRYFGYG